MSRTKHIALATVAALTLAIPALGGTKNPVARPYLGHSTITWTVNMLTGSATAYETSATAYETGEATHLGLYINEASAIYSIDPASFGIVSAAGTVTAADGDQCFWIMTSDQPGVVQVTGGTGRFEGVTGWLAAVSMEEPIIAIDPATMTMTITITYTAAGTLVY